MHCFLPAEAQAVSMWLLGTETNPTVAVVGFVVNIVALGLGFLRAVPVSDFPCEFSFD
jgi:hypothetical protein